MDLLMFPKLTPVRMLAVAGLTLAAGTIAACSEDKTATPAPAMSTPMATATATASPVAKAGALELYAPFGRGPGTPPVAGVFVQIKNTGGEMDNLIAASAAAELTEKVELHETVMTDGSAEMKPVEKIAVAPNSVTALAPGGLHIMLLDLKRALEVSETIDITLTFEKAGEVTMSVPIIEYVADMDMDADDGGMGGD